MKSDQEYFQEAAKVAQSATCKRAQCGTVIVKDGAIIGTGYNSPPLGDETLRTCDSKWDKDLKPKYDKTCCIHAEWRAILNACKTNPEQIVGSTLYFMRIDESGNFTDAGRPFCTVCSRLAVESGIKYFMLFDQGKTIKYDTKKYDRLSYNYYKMNDTKS